MNELDLFWFSDTGSGLMLCKVSLENLRIELLLHSVYDYHPPVPLIRIFHFYLDTSLPFQEQTFHMFLTPRGPCFKGNDTTASCKEPYELGSLCRCRHERKCG